MALAATKIGAAYVEVTAKTDQYKRGMAEIQAQTQRTGMAMQTSLQKVNTGVGGVTHSLHGMHTALAAIGGTYVIHKLAEVADGFSLMRSRIRLVTQAGEDMLKIEEQLAQQAMINRADLKETVGLYTRLRQSRKDLSDAATQNLVDKWSKSLIISASSAQEAASSTQQFAQAMAAGVLSGQELRSVIQGNSAFAVYLAEGLGIATGELKQMGEEGKLTVDAILQALDKSGSTIEHDFQKKALTIHQGLINIETATTRLIGLTDQQFGVSGTIAVWVNALANAINDLALLMQGPAKQAEDAIAKMRAANQAVLNDQPALLEAHHKLEAAIASQGTAAEETARLEVNAIATRIAKNKELAVSYQALARVKLEEAKSALRDAENKRNGAGMAPEAFRLLTMDRIRVKQETNQPLKPTEVTWLEEQVRIDQLRADVAALEKTIADIDKGIGTLPEPVKPAGDGVMKPGKLEDVTEKQLQLERARAENKRELVARLEDEIKVIQLAATLQEKGLNADQAQARAVSHVAALRRAINADDEKQRKNAEDEASLRFQLAIAEAEGDKARIADLETQLEINRRTIDLEEQGLSLDMARARATEEVNKIRAATAAATDKEIKAARELRDLEYQMALAAADGNEKQEKALKRELEIRRAMKDLMTLGYSETEARTVATYRVDTLALKDPTAWDGFERGVSDATKRGLMTAIETGDWGDAFGQILTDVTRDALSRALDVLWEALAQIDWNGQGTGWAGFFNMVGTSFAGNKAGGGDVTAGRMYRVGELGSEWFIPKVDGQIVPNAAGKQLSSQSIMIGAPVVNVYGNADSVTRAEIAETLGAFSRGLPAVIDARVTDRKKRGAY